VVGEDVDKISTHGAYILTLGNSAIAGGPSDDVFKTATYMMATELVASGHVHEKPGTTDFEMHRHPGSTPGHVHLPFKNIPVLTSNNFPFAALCAAS
jgi:hypothetical protein